jgi:hypothetical protein
MSVKLNDGFFNRDKHLATLSRNWIDIQYLSRKRAESVP